MSAAPAPVEVKVGQLWEAYERRRVWVTRRPVTLSGYEERDMVRTLHVIAIVSRNAYGGAEPSARCHVVETGRKVVVALRRMKPGKARGYRLVSEAPAM